MITLIIVDCQNDFITGSLAVNGAKEAVESIKDFVKANRKVIDKVIFTVDWHPYDHCSFKRNGGQWKEHCVQFTPGACIESKLLKQVQQYCKYEVSIKGDISELEQYGAFNEIIHKKDYLDDKYYLNEVSVDANSNIVVCGIAGDYCVKETIKNLLHHQKNNLLNAGIKPRVFLKGIASIDNGITIKNLIKERELDEEPSVNKS